MEYCPDKSKDFDELTALHTYGYFKTVLSKSLEQFGTDNFLNKNISIFIVDIDFFNRINRWYGRQTADNILKEVAVIIKGIVKDSDYLARFGGDEFIVLVENSSEQRARDIAGFIKYHIENHVFNPNQTRLTVSIGFATYVSRAFNTDEFVMCAQEALIEAQRKGGGKIKVFMSEEEEAE